MNWSGVIQILCDEKQVLFKEMNLKVIDLYIG